MEKELFELEHSTHDEVRKNIQECEGNHFQQVAFSSYHDTLTQICYGCRKIRKGR